MSNKKRLDIIKNEVLTIVRNAYDMGEMSDDEVLSQNPWHDWDTNPEELTQYIIDRFGLDRFFLDGETYKEIADIIPIIDKVWDGVTLNDVPEIGLTDNKAKTENNEYVNHPLYGNQPIKSGNNYTIDEIKDSFPGYCQYKIFPNTAIEGDIKLQNYKDDRSLFVDIENECPKCKRKFIFFAKEHKFMAETLGIHVHLGPIFCYECRKVIETESVKDAMKIYTDLINVIPRTNEQQEALNKAKHFLFYEAGYNSWY